jgi:hypothetical protein
MIATAQRCAVTPSPSHYGAEREQSDHKQFLALLPAIRGHAGMTFRHLRSEARQEAVASAVAHAFVAFVRLSELGRAELIYASPLARFAVCRVRDGRQIGCRSNSRDALSDRCRLRKGVRFEGLNQDEGGAPEWREIVVEDRRAGPADIAATRLDFASWLETLSSHDRQVAEVLATGETTMLAAKRLGVTAGRISQLRRKLYKAWRRFQGT